MIVGIGIDAVEIDRIEELLARHGERAAMRLFTPREVALAGSGVRRRETLAARFAAKEAAMKALGAGLGQGVAFAEIEVDRAPSGAPLLRLSGGAAERARAIGATRWLVSLTHTATTASAIVVLEG